VVVMRYEWVRVAQMRGSVVGTEAQRHSLSKVEEREIASVRLADTTRLYIPEMKSMLAVVVDSGVTS
jgi:hypothetical protein